MQHCPENPEVSRAKITMYTKHYRQDINARVGRVKYHSEQWPNFFVHFYLNGLDSAAGNHASIMFALFLSDYDGLFIWPFPKTIQLSVGDQLNAQNTWTIGFAPSEKISFRRPTREPMPTLMNFNFFPHSKMFSKLEKNSLTYPTLMAPQLQHPDHPSYRTPQLISYPFKRGELSRYT